MQAVLHRARTSDYQRHMLLEYLVVITVVRNIHIGYWNTWYSY